MFPDDLPSVPQIDPAGQYFGYKAAAAGTKDQEAWLRRRSGVNVNVKMGGGPTIGIPKNGWFINVYDGRA